MNQNRLADLINAAGGLSAFTRKMGVGRQTRENLKDIVNGERVPGERIRAAIIRAAQGAITHEEILAISGRTKPDYQATYKVDSHWDDDEDERRDWIANKAAAAARAQRLANERAQP